MSRLIIIGAGGHGKVVAETANLCGYHDVGFADQTFPDRSMNGAWPIVCDMNLGASYVHLFLAIGNNLKRAELWNELKMNSNPTLIHPKTTISKYAKLADGVLAVAGVIVNPDTVIGCGTILNTACTIDHDCVIGDFVHVSPGANIAGGCRIGDRSWIGIGASIKQGVTIGCDVTVGAGATVVNDIPNGLTVTGTPAKPLKE